MRFIERSAQALLLVAAVVGAPRSHAAEAKVGMSVSVDGDGFFLNPIVTRIRVNEVQKSSLAERAGIVAGDEIVQIEGQPVTGQRAQALKPYLTFNPGETRTLRLKHENGELFEARITKSKE